MTLLKPATVLFVAAMLLVGAGCDSTKTSNKTQRDVGTVTVEVDFGGEKRAKSIDVVCSPESTVLMSLERAQNLTKLKFESTGSGETAYVKSIDGVEDEGADGKSWTYRVNDKLGDRSAGVFAVNPGDRISWSFANPPQELQ